MATVTFRLRIREPGQPRLDTHGFLETTSSGINEKTGEKFPDHLLMLIWFRLHHGYFAVLAWIVFIL
jgi:hypothetical protein